MTAPGTSRAGGAEEAPELLARYVRAVAVHMLACLLVVTACFLFGSVWPHGHLTVEALAATAERWAETAGRLALPVLGIVVGLLLPLYLAPLGLRDLERRAVSDEHSLTATDHEVLAIQDVREHLILALASVGSICAWWMAPAVLADPVFGLVVVALAMAFGALATIREATFGRAAMHVLRSHRACRGLAALLAELDADEDAQTATERRRGAARSPAGPDGARRGPHTGSCLLGVSSRGHRGRGTGGRRAGGPGPRAAPALTDPQGAPGRRHPSGTPTCSCGHSDLLTIPCSLPGCCGIPESGPSGR